MKIPPVFCALAALCVFPFHADAMPAISEFMASNTTTRADEDGEFTDWIEIHNTDESNSVALDGYHLTDDAGNLTRWTFPAGVNLAANARLVVFASGKNRAVAGSELHTDFQLDSKGEYLALVAPDGTTVLTDFAPEFPPQFEDVSFGTGVPGAANQLDLEPAWNNPGNYSSLLLSGQQAALDSAGTDNLDTGSGAAFAQAYMWLDFSSRLGQIPPGSTVTSAVLAWDGAANASVFGSPAVASNIGIFPVPDANKGLDTIVASFPGTVIADYYAANTPVAEFTANPGQSPSATWDIASLVQDWVDNPLGAQRGQLMMLNESNPVLVTWDKDGANKPTATLTVNLASGQGGSSFLAFFETATPGLANVGGTRAGPVFDDVTKHPEQPVSGPVTITATVRPVASDPVGSVNLLYRHMFESESTLPMVDDGSGNDATAGDGVWTATIPASAIDPAEMTRWRFEAVDASGGFTAEPAFREPLDSHQYWGTVGHDPSIETNLSVVHWFTTNPSGANGGGGSRGALYYLGQLYDNVFFNRHGQSTGGFPKKSYNIDFNKSQRFQWDETGEAPRVADIDLLTNWADKSKVRHSLAYEVMRGSGVKAHFCYATRVQQNGAFFSVADFVEDADDKWLERVGLNTEGSLYKMYIHQLRPGNSVNAPAVEKKNGDPNDRSDLVALVAGLNQSGQALENYMYDNINIPACVTMMAANSVVRNIDMHSKNWYIYRDSGETNEWRLLPWDLDLSHGRVWNSPNTYYDNSLYNSGFVSTGTSVRLVEILFSNPEMRQMMMRRIRTLSDRYLQPPDTPMEERWYERRLDELSALIDDPTMAKSDAQLDFEKWGSWIQPNGNRIPTIPWTDPHPHVETMAEAITRFKDEYLNGPDPDATQGASGPGRRIEIYERQSSIPGPQDDGTSFMFTSLLGSGVPCKAIVPTAGTQAALGINWIGFAEPYDDSAWLSGVTGVGYERGSGYQSMIGLNVNTQMMSNNSCYIRVPFTLDEDPSIYDRLELRMQWDDGFVAFINGTVVASVNAPGSVNWNSAALNASHEAVAGAFDTYDITAHVGVLNVGENILAIQGLNQGTGSSDFIINPELHGGFEGPPILGQPVINFGAIEFNPASGNQEEEYIELINNNGLAVDISDWKLSGAVDFDLPPGTVIPMGGTLYVVPDVVAFRARATSPTGGEGNFVLGGYQGHLSNLGETIELTDDDKVLNNSTTYIGEPSDNQLYLVVSEVMYHPEPDGNAEYVELLNTSDSVTLDLSGVTFSSAFDYVFPAATMLAPGERILVVRDQAAFDAAHGVGLNVAGVFALGALSNDGENVKLDDPDGSTIREFTYNDAAPWPVAADFGYSLVLIDPFSVPEHNDGANWRSSALPGGTPGGSDSIAPPADPLGDSNANGIPDLVDYALGTALEPPIAPAFSREMVDIGAGVMELRPVISYAISLGADAASVTIELTNDLDAWSDDPANLTLLSVENLGDGRAIITVFVNPPFSDGERLYYRLRVDS